MTTALYLQPRGLIYGNAARSAVEAGQAGPLAGGPIAFSMVEVIEGEAGNARRSTRPFSDVASSCDDSISDGLGRLSSPRSQIAGLSLDQPRIMGVVNVTPDSFSDGGQHDTAAAAIAHGRQLIGEGADIIDIGGESTRPGSEPVDAITEADRVLPVIDGLKDSGTPVSIDTRKATVMEQAVAKGAKILNDVSALTHEPLSLKVASASGQPVILMHAQGDPKTMQDDPAYDDVLLEVYDYLDSRIQACEAAGIAHDKLVVDPGIGFGKTLDHNLTLLDGMALFHGLGVPVLLGASRKRFIGALADEPDAQKRMPGSVAAALSAVARGVQLIRVHDVAETRQALTVCQAINSI